MGYEWFSRSCLLLLSSIERRSKSPAANPADQAAWRRVEGEEHENLTFFTHQLVASVAKRHRGIENDPDMIKTWIEILGLNDVKDLLSRLALMLDAITGGDWWIDRNALRARLPVN